MLSRPVPQVLAVVDVVAAPRRADVTPFMLSRCLPSTVPNPASCIRLVNSRMEGRPDTRK